MSEDQTPQAPPTPDPSPTVGVEVVESLPSAPDPKLVSLREFHEGEDLSKRSDG